jgi:excisionase family DNA binding protein
MKHELKECANILEPTRDHDSAVSQAEVLGSEIGDLARRLFSLFALPSGTNTTPRLLTAQEVADVLKTNTQVVYRLARNRELPAVNLGQRMLRFTEASVYEFVRRGGVGRAA